MIGSPLSKDPAQVARYGTGGMRELRFEPNAERVTRGAVAAVLALPVTQPARKRPGVAHLSGLTDGAEIGRALLLADQFFHRRPAFALLHQHADHLPGHRRGDAQLVVHQLNHLSASDLLVRRLPYWHSKIHPRAQQRYVRPCLQVRCGHENVHSHDRCA